MNMQLNDNELSQVVGGTKEAVASLDKTKKAEFEAAWDALKLDEKGYTGNMRAEIFEDWEAAGFEVSATSFLSKIK